MHAFTLTRPADAGAATAAAAGGGTILAGGTDLMQLWRDNVEAASVAVDLDALPLRDITATSDGLRIGALATMAQVAANADVRARWPAISEALLSAASPQVRNMGTAGGNLLQRTRCGYFRNTAFDCNKRVPGSGCPAIHGDNRMLGVVGMSASCIATHPSDMPVALRMMDASVELLAPGGGTRTVPLEGLYREWGDTPNVETTLRPGELVTAILVPDSAAARHSTYLKVRDRTSFEFALVSAAVGLDVQGGTVRDARVALGGVGPMPWRLPEVEAALRGKPATDETFAAAAALASQGATAQSQNAYKLKLMGATVRRGLQTLAA